MSASTTINNIAVFKAYRYTPTRDNEGRRVIDTTEYRVVNHRLGEVCIKKTVSGPERSTWIQERWFPTPEAIRIMGKA